MTTTTLDRIHVPPRTTGCPDASGESRQPSRPRPEWAPIVVAVDGTHAASAATRTAVRMARDLAAPLVFVYVRRGPSAALGEPYYQRRLDREMRIGRRALSDAVAMAEHAGVPATSEQLAGSPARRVMEFARLRGARMVVLGSRRRRLRRSVSRDVVQAADRPVLVAGRATPVAA